MGANLETAVLKRIEIVVAHTVAVTKASLLTNRTWFQILIPILITLTIGLILSFNQSQNTNSDRTFIMPKYNAIHHSLYAVDEFVYFGIQVNVLHRCSKNITFVMHC